MRRLDSKAKQASLHTPSSPLKKIGSRPTTDWRSARPLDKDYYLNQQIPPGILLGFSSPLPRGSRNPTAKRPDSAHRRGYVAVYVYIYPRRGMHYASIRCICIELLLEGTFGGGRIRVMMRERESNAAHLRPAPASQQQQSGDRAECSWNMRD